MPSISRRAFSCPTSGALAAGALPRPRPAQTSGRSGPPCGRLRAGRTVIVAVDKGFFRTENINVEFVPFRGGPNLVKAVIAGDVLLGATGSTDILVFREAGMPIKMVATHTEGNHFTLNVLLTSPRSATSRASRSASPRSAPHLDLRPHDRQKQQGWDADRDVKIVALGGARRPAGRSGPQEIHAFVWGDGGAVTQLAGKSKVLMRLDKITSRWISQIQYTSEDAIRKQGDDIRKVMKGVFAAIRFMNDQTAEAAEIVSKKIGWSAEAVQAAHKISGSLMSHDGTMSLEALRSMQDTVLEHGVIKKRLPVEEHVAGSSACQDLGPARRALGPAVAGGSGVAHAQLFLPHAATRVRHRPRSCRPRTPDLGPIVVDVLFSVDIPDNRSVATRHDLYCCGPAPWCPTGPAAPRPRAREVLVERGFDVIDSGRVVLASRNLYRGEAVPPPRSSRRGAVRHVVRDDKASGCRPRPLGADPVEPAARHACT